MELHQLKVAGTIINQLRSLFQILSKIVIKLKVFSNNLSSMIAAAVGRSKPATATTKKEEGAINLEQ
jgi:hypothetical protein